MQQHTGQHVLSAAFDKLFGVADRQLSSRRGGVDDRPRARDVAGRDRRRRGRGEPHRLGRSAGDDPLRDAEEAARLPLRKEPARGGTLRLIEVEDFDLSACGGTHVARTGGIGVIAVASWERFKGGQRLEFLCGGRALGGYRVLRDVDDARACGCCRSCPEELPGAIERLQADAKDQKRIAGRPAGRARAIPARRSSRRLPKRSSSNRRRRRPAPMPPGRARRSMRTRTG